jgi:hypothetical protein
MSLTQTRTGKAQAVSVCDSKARRAWVIYGSARDDTPFQVFICSDHDVHVWDSLQPLLPMLVICYSELELEDFIQGLQPVPLFQNSCSQATAATFYAVEALLGYFSLGSRCIPC